ncbi:MAG: hypothetical protein HYX74_07460 [Acidobacteria bacterium]|nr:hypothetical protein [Acidobacteriota bacterium]
MEYPRLLSRLERTHSGLLPFEFKTGERVEYITGQTGRVVEGWHAPRHVSYAIELDDDGRVIDVEESELKPAFESARPGGLSAGVRPRRRRL